MFTEKNKNYRFGVCELNSLSRQLLKNGRGVRVQEQAAIRTEDADITTPLISSLSNFPFNFQTG